MEQGLEWRRQARSLIATLRFAERLMLARGGSQSLRESRRAPRKKTCACLFNQLFSHSLQALVFTSNVTSCGFPVHTMPRTQSVPSVFVAWLISCTISTRLREHTKQIVKLSIK